MISTSVKTGVYGQETRKPGITRPKEADLASHVRSLNLTKSGRQFASSGPGLHATEKAGRDARALTMTASLKRPQGTPTPPLPRPGRFPSSYTEPSQVSRPLLGDERCSGGERPSCTDYCSRSPHEFAVV